jgi:uncharacterized protein
MDPMSNEHRQIPARGVPAGKVLLGGLLGLAVAALLNAGALLRDAEQKPLGRGRDISLAIWEPVESLSSALQITKPQLWADEAFGRDPNAELFELPVNDSVGAAGDESVNAAATTPADGAETPEPNDAVTADNTPSSVPETTLPAAPATTEVWRPMIDDRLRMWVVGDSVVNYFGATLASMANGTGVVEASSESLRSSGLTRPDFFDWPARLNEIVLADDPELMIVMFGGNDAQGIITPDGAAQPFGEAWTREYSTRVGGVMDLLVTSGASEGGRQVVWVGQPIMDADSFDVKMQELNAIYANEAAKRGNVLFVSTRELFADESGGYSRFLTGPDGAVVDVRLADGVHLSTAGGRWLSELLLERIQEIFDLSGDPAPLSLGSSGGSGG